MASVVLKPEEISLANVSSLLDQIKEGDEVSLDLSQVRRFDTAGAQLITAARRAGVVLASPSPLVTETMQALGLLAELA